MSRCLSCNCVLSDFELTRRSATSKEFIDLCNSCFSTISDEVDVLERDDLRHTLSLEDELDDDNEEGEDDEF